MTVQQYRKKGVITVFLALLLTVMTGFICIIIESVRLQLIRLEVERLMDAGLYSCFGEYDQNLFKSYDLLFIDSSYKGKNNADIDEVIYHLTQYITENANYEQYADIYRENVMNAKPDEYVLASDNSGLAIKSQAIDFISNYGNLKYINTINANRNKVGNTEADSFFSQWDNILLKIDMLGLNITNPGRVVRDMTVSDDDFLSLRQYSNNTYIDIPSKRSLKRGIYSGNLADNPKNDVIFVEYIMQKCGCYTENLSKQYITGEIEYIIYGHEGDKENLSDMINSLMSIREADNLRVIKGDEGKKERAYNLALLVLNNSLIEDISPYAIELVRDSIIYAWAYAESCIDVARLINGGRCKIDKSANDVHLSIDELLLFKSKLHESGGEGFTYKEYTGFFLANQSDINRRVRMMDVIESNMRMNNSLFRVDGCIEYLMASVELTSGYGYSHTIKRDCEYE